MPTLQDLSTSSSTPTIDPSTLITQPEEQPKPVINLIAPPVPASSLATPSVPTTSFPALGTLSQLSDKPVNQDDLIKKAIATSPDPIQADAKRQLAETLGDWYGMPPSFVHQNIDAITGAMYGQSVKGQPPTNVLQKVVSQVKAFGGKVGNTIQEEGLVSQLNTLNQQLREKPGSESIQVARDDVKKQIGSLGPTLSFIPKAIVDIVYQMGYQVVHEAKSIANDALATISLEAMRHPGGFQRKDGFMTASIEESQKVIGSISGSVYGNMIDKGVDPNVANWASFGIGVGMELMQALPVGLESAKLGSVVLDGTVRAGLNGTIDAAAKALPSIIGEAGTQIGFAAAASMFNTLVPEMAAAYSNAFKGTSAERTSALDLLKQTGEGMIPQLILAGGAIGLREFTGFIQERGTAKIRERIATEQATTEATIRAEEAVKAVQEKAKAPVEPEHPITAAEKEAAPQRTISEIMENDPSIPKVKPAGEARPGEGKSSVSKEQLASMIEKAKAAHGEDITLPGIKKSWEESVTTEDGDAMLWYNDASGSTHAIREPIQEMATPIEPLPRKLTEEQGRALDEATRSEEGTADYIEHNSDIKALNEKIVKLQNAGDEFKDQLEQAKVDKTASVKALREQIKTREEQKQYLRDIAKVDTSRMRPEFAEPVNKILEEFTLDNFNKNTILKLNTLRDLIDEHPEMDVPKDVLRKLGELDKTPFKSLPPDGLKAIRDAVVSYAKAQSDAQKVMFEGRVAEKDAVVNQIRSELPETKPLKPGKNGEPATINAGANKVTQAKDSVRKIQDTVGQRAERIGLVADRVSPTLKKAVVDPLMEGHRGMDKTDSAFHAQFHDLTKEITDVVVNLEPWLAKKETILLRDESLGALSPNESAVQSTPVNVNIDRAHRLAIYMHSLNPDNARHMIDGGIGFKYSGSDLRNRVFRIDEATVLKIQDMVRSNPEELKLTQVVSDLLRNMGLEEAKVYLRENGIPLELVDNYYHIETMPGRRGMTADEEVLSTEAKKQFSGIGLAKGRLQPRVESSIPIYINPITFDLAKSQEHNSAYVNLEGPLRSVGRILRDRDLKESMANTIGETTHKILVKAAKDVAGMKDPASDMNNFWGKSKNRMTTGLMALPNVFVPLKQPAALSRYTTTGYVRGDYLVKGLVDSLLHPKTTEKTMRENSAFYDRRSESGGRPETSSVIKSQVTGSEYGGKSNWKSKAMQGIGWMETRGSVRPGMRGAVLQFIDDIMALKDEGKAIPRGSLEKYQASGIDVDSILRLPEQERPDAINAAAYRYAEVASENTQTSGNPLLQSDLQRGTTSEQVLTSFMSEGFTAANMRRTAFLEGQRMGNVKGWLKVSGVFVGTLILEPAYEMMVNRTRRAITGTDNPDIKKEALYQFISTAFSGIPIANQVVQSIAAKIVIGWNFSNNSVTPIDNLVNVGTTAVDRLLNPSSYKTAKGKLRLTEDMASFFTVLSGYAVLPGVKLVEGVANVLNPQTSVPPKQPFLESVLQGRQK